MNSQLGSNSSVGSFKNLQCVSHEKDTSKAPTFNKSTSVQDNVSERSTYSRGAGSKLPRLGFKRSKGHSGSLQMPQITKTNSSPPMSSHDKPIEEDPDCQAKNNTGEKIEALSGSRMNPLSPLVCQQKSSLKKRNGFTSASGEKKPNSMLATDYQKFEIYQ